MGNSTAFSFNPLNEPNQQTVSSHTLGPLYDPAGYTTSVTNLQTGAVTEYKVDMLGDRYETDYPNASSGDTDGGPVSNNYYNADQQLVMSVDTLGNKTTYGYDFLGDQVTASLPDPSSGDPSSTPSTTDTFNLDSEKVQSVDALGYTSTWTMDAFGNTIAYSLPDPESGAAGGPTTTWTFTAAHQVLTQTDPDGNTTSWGLDFDGQTKSENISSTAVTETYTRDADGNVIELDDFDGRKTTYTYNSLNQETGENWYATTTGDPYASLAYAYDVRGDMTGGSESYSGGGGTYADPGLGTNSGVALTYNGPGEVTGESQGLAGRASVILSQTWNNDGTRNTLAVNIGGTLNSDGTASDAWWSDLLNTYGYDKIGEMTSIAQTSQTGFDNVTAKYVALGYDNGGDLTSVDSYLAGSDTSADKVYDLAIAYNHNSQVTSLAYAAGTGSTILAAYAYSYDPDRQVSGMSSYTDTADTADRTSDPATWASASYEYTTDQEVANVIDGGSWYSGGDGAAATYVNWANAPTTDNNLSYDANGNRNESGQTISAGNQVTFDGTYYFTFDAEGNRTAKYKSTSGSLDGTATDITTYGWDNRNRMTLLKHYADYDAYTSASPDMALARNYDVFDRLTEEAQTAGGSLDERYIWDGGSLLDVLDSGDNTSERYLNGPAVDQVLATEQVGGTGDSGGSAGPVNWLLADAQQSVRDVVRGVVSDGSVSVSLVDHVVYDVYGNQPVPQTATDSLLQTRIGFRGMMIDALAGFGGGGTSGSGGGSWSSPSGSPFGLYYSVAEAPTTRFPRPMSAARRATRAAR